MGQEQQETGRASITIRENKDYRGVLGRHLTEDDVIPNVELIRRHKRVLGCLLVDQVGSVLAPYPLWDAVRIIGAEDPELGAEMLAELLAGARIVDVADQDHAATLIRAVTLSQDLGTGRANLIIADQVRQHLRWIGDHRVVIDERNPSYVGLPIRPAANWIGGLVNADNKRVERIYRARNNAYGLEEYAGLPSLGADLVIQKGVRTLRGRTRQTRDQTSVPLAASRLAPGGSLPDPTNDFRNVGSARARHPAVEAVRRLFQAPTPEPAWSPPGPFSGAADQMPPTDPDIPIGEGGIGVHHLYTVARLLEEGNHHFATWSTVQQDYVRAVLGAFQAWVEDCGAVAWGGRSAGRDLDRKPEA